MKKQVVLMLSLLSLLLTGCTDQKTTATRQRWLEIKIATDNLFDALAYINQSTNIESKDALAESLAMATSTINACQMFKDALSSQKKVNVDPRLNDLAEKLINSSDVVITQTRRGQNALISAQRLSKELETTTDPQRQRQISMEANAIMNEIESVSQMGTNAKNQMSECYQELEVLRLDLNKQYGFELPQIKG